MITIHWSLMLLLICSYAWAIYMNDKKHRKDRKKLREYAETAIKQRQEREKKTYIVQFGVALPKHDNRNKRNYNVTSAYIDSFSHDITLSFQYGIEVKRYVMTMEHAENIGFINWDALVEIAEASFKLEQL